MRYTLKIEKRRTEKATIQAIRDIQSELGMIENSPEEEAYYLVGRGGVALKRGFLEFIEKELQQVDAEAGQTEAPILVGRVQALQRMKTYIVGELRRHLERKTRLEDAAEQEKLKIKLHQQT